MRKLFFTTILLVLCLGQVWGGDADRTFNGTTDKLFINNVVPGDWPGGDLWAKDDNTQMMVYLVGKSPTSDTWCTPTQLGSSRYGNGCVYCVTPPAGTYSNLILKRGPLTETFDDKVNQTDNIRLNDTYNHLTAFNASGGAKTWNTNTTHYYMNSDGNATLYFNIAPSSFSTWICGENGSQNFVTFFNGNTNSGFVPVQKVDETHYKAVLPEGTWAGVILSRHSSTSPTWENKYNQTGDLLFVSTKNYLSDFNENTVVCTWDNYVPDPVIVGSMNDWKLIEAKSLASGSVDLTLDEHTTHWFRIFSGTNTWEGNASAFIGQTGQLTMNENSDCHLLTAGSGTYRFTYNSSTKQMTVIYPSVTHPTEDYIYFKNVNSWSQVNVHLWHTADALDVVADTWPGPLPSTFTFGNDTYYYVAIGGETKAHFSDNADGTKRTGDLTDITSNYGKWFKPGGPTYWNAFTSALTLDLNGGEAGDESVTATYNAALPSFTLATHASHTLVGYYTAAAGGTRVIDESGDLIAGISGWTDGSGHWIMTKDTTLYAKWIVNIPQASAGTYIPIGTIPATSGDKTPASGVTLVGCQVDGNYGAEAYTSYTVGSTNGNPMSITISLNATEAGNYLFSFKSGHSQGTAEVSLSLKNSSDEVIWNNGGNNVSISNTGNWALTEAHTFLLGDLEAGTYTLTITGVSKSGSYYGNFGNFCFHTPTTLAMPYDLSHELNVSMAKTSGLNISGTYLTSITAGSYADEMYMYISDAGYYQVYAGYGYATAGTDQFTITITDMSTGTAEVNAQNYTVTSSMRHIMKDRITTGWKKIRLDHPRTPDKGSFRLEHMYFIPVQTMPVVSTDSVNVRLATVSGLKVDGNYLTQITTSSYADDIYMEVPEDGYYQVHAGYGWATEGTDQFTITITDVNTSTTEVNAKNFVITSAQNYLMTNYITAGLKKIRLDYPGLTITDKFRLEHMYFEKIPNLPITGTSTLNLNQLGVVFNDCRYEEANANIGYVKNGSYADNYIVYNESAGIYALKTNIQWYSKGGTFKITITDIATDEVEVDAEESSTITGTGDVEFALNDRITTGFKKIRFDFVHEGESGYLFNINNVSFYTRTLTYDDNGGSGGPGSELWAPSATNNLSSTAPTRAGYEFMGWNMEEDGSGATTYAAGDVFTMPTTNTTLYATWKFVIYRTGDAPDGGAETFAGGAIDWPIEYRMKVNTLDQWNSLYLPFTVDAIKVIEDGVYYDIQPYYRPNVGGPFYQGHYIIRTPAKTEDFEIANFGDWRDPSSYVFTPSGNTPYVIMWHDIYFRGKYIAFIGHKDTAIPTSMTAGDRPTKDSVVNVYGNDAMISGSVEDGYTLEADYGNGSWLREEKIGDSRTVLPFECYLRANATTTPIFKVVRKHDTTTGIDQTENRESRIENRKLIRDGQVVILRDNKMYNVLGMEIQ